MVYSYRRTSELVYRTLGKEKLPEPTVFSFWILASTVSTKREPYQKHHRIFSDQGRIALVCSDTISWSPIFSPATQRSSLPSVCHSTGWDSSYSRDQVAFALPAIGQTTIGKPHLLREGSSVSARGKRNRSTQISPPPLRLPLRHNSQWLIVRRQIQQ